MAMPSKTDPETQDRDHPTLKEQVKGENARKKQDVTTDKVAFNEDANPAKPDQVHGHNVNRAGGGSK